MEDLLAGDHVEEREGRFYREGNEISRKEAEELGWQPETKMLILLDEKTAKDFIEGDPQAHHRAEQEIKARLTNQIENPTVEEKFEAAKRGTGDGLLVRQEDIKTGEVQAGFMDIDGDYLLILGPRYEVHTTTYPGTGTTQLTIKKAKN